MNRTENILNFKKNDANLSTSGQPKEIEFGLIANKEFEVVINIRPESEMLDVFDEKKIVENLGLKYYQLPITFDTLTSKILSQFFNLMEQNKEKKKLVHCRRNIRVAVVLALYRIIKLGWNKEDAYKGVYELIEVTSELETYIEGHISNFSKENLK